MQAAPVMMAVTSFLSLLMPISAIVDPQCDFYQELVMGQEYYIYNTEYPNYYPPSSSCRWVGKSPEGTNIILSCENVELPLSTNCQGDKLSVSLTGDENFSDAINYCGQTKLTLLSENNAISVGLFATSTSTGGRFTCALTALQITPATTTTKRPNTCDCGWKHETRIIGGHDTGINEYPSMAAMVERFGELFCGASIISDRYALTAAHCLYNQVPGDVALFVGDFNIDLSNDTVAAATYIISEFKPHPLYDMATQQNDIAVLKTNKPIIFSMLVGPVCLPFRYTGVDFYRQIVTVLGWGFVDFSGPKSKTLQAADLSVVSNQDCAAAIPDPVSNNQLCTYAPNKDACTADSGGPLIWQDPSTRKSQLVGIISFGVGCATSKPGVNTRVTSYLSWILSVTRDAVYCIK